MVKYFQGISSFVYSWDQVAKAFWSRYPNPYSSHVLSEDTIVREMRGDYLYTKRLLTKTNPMPKWGERFTPNTLVAIIEESYINPEEKTMVTFTHNIGYNRVMSVEEKVLYYPTPDNPAETTVEREAWIESKLFGFRRAIEKFGLERFRKNCDKAVKGFNHVLGLMYPAPPKHLIALGFNRMTPNHVQESIHGYIM